MSENVTEVKVLDGIDLILSIDGDALGFSTGCKITTTTETGERLTKEKAGGTCKEQYVKSISEESPQGQAARGRAHRRELRCTYRQQP